MPRTSTAAVQLLLSRDYDGSTDLQQYVDTATAIVDRVEACAIARGVGLSAAELELIERWLSAHAYVQMDQTYTSKSTSKASGSFGGQLAMHLDNSKYGQMASSLDPSGCLNAIANRLVASGFWLGKNPTDQIDYEDRR